MFLSFHRRRRRPGEGLRDSPKVSARILRLLLLQGAWETNDGFSFEFPKYTMGSLWFPKFLHFFPQLKTDFLLINSRYGCVSRKV